MGVVFELFGYYFCAKKLNFIIISPFCIMLLRGIHCMHWADREWVRRAWWQKQPITLCLVAIAMMTASLENIFMTQQNNISSHLVCWLYIVKSVALYSLAEARARQKSLISAISIYQIQCKLVVGHIKIYCSIDVSASSAIKLVEKGSPIIAFALIVENRTLHLQM